MEFTLKPMGMTAEFERLVDGEEETIVGYVASCWMGIYLKKAGDMFTVSLEGFNLPLNNLFSGETKRTALYNAMSAVRESLTPDGRLPAGYYVKMQILRDIYNHVWRKS